MITEQQYKDALGIVNKYREQLKAENFSIDKHGRVKGATIRIKQSKTGRQQAIVKGYGLATMVATKYVSNPHGYSRIIFKDDNPLNCSADNLVWVSNVIFALNLKVNRKNCPLGKGRNKIELDPKEAYLKAKDEDLKKYYLTKNDKVLKALWNKIDSEITMRGWDSVKAECYLYFMDRCKRNSLLGNPYAFIIAIAQIRIKSSNKSLNTSLAKDCRKIDESIIRSW